MLLFLAVNKMLVHSSFLTHFGLLQAFAFNFEQHEEHNYDDVNRVSGSNYSLQNSIKIKSRTSLLPASLERVIKLLFFGEAVTHWNRSHRRHLTRLYQSCKSISKQNDPDLQHDFTFNESELEECKVETGSV